MLACCGVCGAAVLSCFAVLFGPCLAVYSKRRWVCAAPWECCGCTHLMSLTKPLPCCTGDSTALAGIVAALNRCSPVMCWRQPSGGCTPRSRRWWWRVMRSLCARSCARWGCPFRAWSCAEAVAGVDAWHVPQL